MRVPKAPGASWNYQKFNRRAQDWAIVGVAAVEVNGATQVSLVNMGSTPLRAEAVESALAGGASATEAAEVAAEGTDANSPLEVSSALADRNYLADEGLATVVYLAISMQRPLFLEGDAGVGKTELAKVLASWTGGELIRLQCYEGIDASQALYEWDYTRQLLHLRAAEASGRATKDSQAIEDELYSERFLIRRPLLRAIDHGDQPQPVLLIDEVDRADDEFEAFLLEVLSDHTVTIPELGTFGGKNPPLVVVTSNRTRDVHDALKRRCLYHWLNHPDLEREVGLNKQQATAGG